MWVTTRQAAELLDVSERTVQRWARAGRLRSREVEGRGRAGKVLLVWVESSPSPQSPPIEGGDRIAAEAAPTNDTLTAINDTTNDTLTTFNSGYGGNGKHIPRHGTNDTLTTTNDTLTTRDFAYGHNEKSEVGGGEGGGLRQKLEGGLRQFSGNGGNAQNASNGADSGLNRIAAKGNIAAKTPKPLGNHQKKDSPPPELPHPGGGISKEEFRGGPEWLTVKQVASLEGVDERTVRWRIREGRYEVREVSGKGGKRGKVYLIHFRSLPVEAQVRYFTDGEAEGLGVHLPEGTKEWQVREMVKRWGAVSLYQDLVKRGHTRMAALQAVQGRYGIGKSTFYRWLSSFEKKGILGLVPRDKPSRAVPGTEAFLNEVRMYYRSHREKMTLKEAYELAKMRAEKEGWPVLSYWRVARILRQEKQALEYERFGRQYWRKNHMPKVMRNRRLLKVMEVVVADFTYLKILVRVLEKTGGSWHWRVVQPVLGVMMDRKTRMPVSYWIDLYPSSRAFAEMIRMAVLPKVPYPMRQPVFEMPTRDPFVRRLVEAMVKVGERYGEYGAMWPAYGVPRVFYVDWGKEFHARRFKGGRIKEEKVPDWEPSEVLGDTMRLLGAELVATREPYSAWQKGEVEEFFDVVKTRLIPHLPGGKPLHGVRRGRQDRDKFTKRDWEALKEEVDQGRILTMEELRAVFEAWLVFEYLGRLHPERVEQFIQGMKVTDLRVPSETTMGFLLQEHDFAKVYSMGIKRWGKVYWHDGLMPLIGQKVEVRWFDHDRTRLWIFHRGRFVGVAEVNEPEDVGEVYRRQRAAEKLVREYHRQIDEHEAKHGRKSMIELWIENAERMIQEAEEREWRRPMPEVSGFDLLGEEGPPEPENGEMPDAPVRWDVSEEVEDA